MKTTILTQLRGIAWTGSGTSMVLILFQLYYTNYDFVLWLNVNWTWGDLHIFSNPTWMFLDTVKTRYIIIGLSCFFVLYPTTEAKTKTLVFHILHLFVLAILFVIIFYIPRYSHLVQFLYIVASLIIWIRLLNVSKYIAAYLGFNSLSLKENQKTADGFEQSTQKIETPESVNLPYTFSYKERSINGWLNIISMFRASSVIGLPGSGKSYSFLQPMMRQLINKKFCAVVYDYKDPTLSKSAYNYWKEYLNTNSNETIQTRFGYISFKNINSTYRCNPLKNINTAAESVDAANTILVSLNPYMETKKGEFFVESAEKFTALIVYSLGLMDNGKHQSLPHILTMLTTPYQEVFPILSVLSIFVPDMGSMFSAFAGAASGGAEAQLQGQIGSAQIGLGGLADAILSFVMTEDENPTFNIDLDVNSLTEPKILCLGNDPTKDKVYGLANSVYLSRIAKIINKKGTPCLFAVDELPTVYVKGIDNLIGTARSNKVAVALGYQDYSQIKRDYGDKIANTVINTSANIFAGAVKGETAKVLSDSFGDKTVLRKTTSKDSSGSISSSYAEHKEKRLPIDKIEELSQGEFVGRVVDTFTDKIAHKVFHGTIHIDKSYNEEPYEIPKLRDWSDEEIIRNTQLNLIKVKNEVADLLAQANEAAAAYSTLDKITYIHPLKEQNFALEKFINSPNQVIHLAIWCEAAFFVIFAIEKLHLVNDLLDRREKIQLLIRSLWTKSAEYEKIVSTIDEYNFYDPIAIKQYILNYVAANQ